MRFESKGIRSLLALLFAFALIGAACGSSGDDTSADTDSGSDSVSNDTGSDDSGADDDAMADAASGDPLVFGMINMELGPLNLNEVSKAAVAAADHVNTNLGGINGRPIQLEVCATDGSPAASESCATKLMDLDPVAFVGGIDVGSIASVEVLRRNNMALIGGGPITPIESNYENAVFFIGLSTADNAAAAAYLAEDVGVSKVAVIHVDDVGGSATAEGVALPLEARGIEVVRIPFPPDAPDLSPQVATAIAESPDAVFSASPIACIPIFSGLRNQGYTGAISGIDACSTAETIEAAGGAVEGLIAGGLVDLVDSSNPDTAEFLAAMDEFAAADDPRSQGAVVGFQAVMNIHNALDAHEDFSTESILAAFREGSDHPNFMAYPYTCDGTRHPAFSAVCNSHSIILQIVDGERVNVRDWFSAYEG